MMYVNHLARCLAQEGTQQALIVIITCILVAVDVVI